ncbi:efflux pump protein [Xylariales sp. PMI_506]|nr:efflux pump protein [Xylariales sp. PMI_506]
MSLQENPQVLSEKEAGVYALSSSTKSTTAANGSVNPTDMTVPQAVIIELEYENPNIAIMGRHGMHLKGFRLFSVVGSVTIVAFVLMLDQSVLSTAIPQITAEFRSLSDVGWYIGAYQLASAAFQPITGKLYTYFRCKWTFLIFLIVFELGSLVCGVSKSSAVLIGGRTIAGLGASGLMNGGMTILAGTAPPSKQPLYIGYMLAVSQFGLILGPIIGGALTEWVTWRWCFYINLPVGGIAAVVLLLVEISDDKEPFSSHLLRSTIPELDLIGFVLCAPAVTMLLLALQLGSNATFAWRSSTIIGLFCGAAVAILLFVLWERRMGDRAMIPGSVAGQHIVWSSVSQTVFMIAVVTIISTYLPIYFQAVKGVGAAMSGVYLLPSILVQLLFVIVSGATVSKIGYYLPWVVFADITTAIGAGLMSTLSATTSTGKWVGYQIIMGAGRGSAMQMSFAAIQNALPKHQISVGIAFLIFCQNMSAAVSIVVANTIFTQSLLSEIVIRAPSVSPQVALDAGSSASAVRALVPSGSTELYGVLEAFSISIDRVFYLMTAFGVLAFCFSWGMGWKNISKHKPTEEEAAR